MSQSSPPSPPNTAQTYGQGLATFLKYLPQMLNTEVSDRNTYDPQFIEHQQQLENKYGPIQRQQQLAALDQLNPYFRQVYGALGNSVLSGLDKNNPYVNQANTLQNEAFNNRNIGNQQAINAMNQTASDLALGTKLDPSFQTQLQSEIRGAEAARGNTLGNAPVAAEDLYQGRAAQDLYNQRLQRYLGANSNLESTLGSNQQRAMGAGQYAGQQRELPIANAGQFLSGNNPAQMAQAIEPVSAPNAFQYVNPNAGYLGQQIGQQNYQNQLAAYSMQNQGGGWGSILGGAASGASSGAMFGPYGAIIGGVAGAGLGAYNSGYFSDRRMKEDITDTGEHTRDKIPIVTFRYKGHKPRIKGVIAQDVIKVRPDAVFGTPSGFLGVRYDKLGLQPEVV